MTDVGTVLRKTENRIKSTIAPVVRRQRSRSPTCGRARCVERSSEGRLCPRWASLNRCRHQSTRAFDASVHRVKASARVQSIHSQSGLERSRRRDHRLSQDKFAQMRLRFLYLRRTREVTHGSGRPDRRHGCEALLRKAERVVAIRSKLSIASPALDQKFATRTRGAY
jgi:hypothetical protein